MSLHAQFPIQSLYDSEQLSLRMSLPLFIESNDDRNHLSPKHVHALRRLSVLYVYDIIMFSQKNSAMTSMYQRGSDSGGRYQPSPGSACFGLDLSPTLLLTLCLSMLSLDVNTHWPYLLSLKAPDTGKSLTQKMIKTVQELLAEAGTRVTFNHCASCVWFFPSAS